MPLVTIIINVFNGEATLSETIDSALAQTFNDFELLIWDDCSSDNSAGVVSEYDDPRIRYVRSEAQIPLGQARQAAISAAQGEWVAFLDQDDLWLPQKLELQLARAREMPKGGLVYGRTVRFYPDEHERDYDQAHEYAPLPEGNIFSTLFVDSCYIAMSSAMFRRSAIEEVGGVPSWIRIIPDYYLYTAVARRFPAAAVQQVVCWYRIRSGSASESHAIEVHSEALRLMDFWEKDVDAAVLAQCRRHHATQLALAEMRSGGIVRGLRRLLREGSVGSQLMRPFWFGFHWVRRNMVKPWWKRGLGD
jgi:glycosyltransferase involved in cell wall biosynthesis